MNRECVRGHQERGVGRTPLHLLKTTDHNIERIAGMVGYADGVSLRTLLRRRLGRPVRERRAMA